MAIGITGANNGYSRTAADNRFFSLTGGTINGNVVINGSLSASQYLGITGGGGGGGGDYLPLSGGTVNGNLTITGTLCTTLLEALSANITVLDIKQYELSGFNVQGNATVQGTVSANNTIYGNSFTVPANGIINSNIANSGYIQFVDSLTTTFHNGQVGVSRDDGFICKDSRGYSWNDGLRTGDIALRRLNTNTLVIGNRFATETRSLAVSSLSATGDVRVAGNVGIGTSTPSTKLEVVGSIGKFNVTDEGYSTSMTRSNSNLRFTGFNLGIISFAGTADGYTTQQTGAQINSLTEGTGAESWQLRPAANLLFHTTPNLSGAVLTERMRITGAGNVGVGTTTPTAKLDIVDTTLAGSGALLGSILNLSQTWNTTSAPTAIKLNVTNTGSGAASNLFDLQVDTVSKFKVDKNGVVTVTNSATGGGGAGQGGIFNEGGLYVLWSAGAVGAGAGGFLGFNNNNNYTTSGGWDVRLFRDGAGTLAQRNGVNPQESRIYGTYTSATNFERLNLKYNATDFAFQIGTAKGSAGGAARPLELQTDGTTRMTITSAGLVSIMPNQSQTVNGTGLRLYDNNAGAFLEINQQYGDFALRTTYGNQRFTFYAVDNILASVSNGVTYFVGAGNFGIGTFAPSAKLDVVDTTLAGSGGLSGSVLSLTQTWNTSSSPTAIQLNVTDTSSNAASLLMDLRVGARSSYAFGKTTLTLPPSAGSGIVWSGVSAQNQPCSITRAANDTLAIMAKLGGGKYINIGGDGYGLTIYNGQIQLNTGLKDVYLANDDNNILTQRNGGSPQAFRLYNTYTNTTTFERLNLQWQTNVFKFGTEKGSAGGLARSMEFQTDGTTRMTMTSAGDIGVRTTTPGNLLHIDCTLNKGILLTNSTQAPGRANFYINAGQPGAYNAFNIMESYDSVLYGILVTYQRSIYLGGFANAVSTASVTVLNDQNKLDLLQLRQGLIGSSTVFKVASSGDTTIYGTVSAIRYLGLQDSLSGNPVLIGGNSTGTDLLIGTNDNYALNLETAGSTKMTVTSAGLVGIGVTTPAYTLDIPGTGDTSLAQIAVGKINHAGGIRFRRGSDGASPGYIGYSIPTDNGSGFSIYAGGGTGAITMQAAAGPVLVYAGNVNPTIFAANGSLGINTLTPVAKLDVVDTTLAGSGGLSGSVLKLTQTWNTSGAPTAITLNVTNSASGAASNLIDLQVDNISRFKFTKNGAIDFGPSNTANQRSVINSGTGQLTIFARGDVPTQAYAAAGLYNGVNAGLFLGSGFGLQWSSGSFADGGGYDTFLTRRAAANLRLGNPDVAAPVAQTLSVQSVVAGTTNTAGTNFTIAGSQGTGTGAGGSIIFQTAPAGSSGTAQNPLSSSIVIDGQGVLNIPAAPVGNTTGMLRVVHEQTGVLRPGIYATSYGDMSLATYGNGGPANIGCMYSKFIFSKRGIVVGASGPYAYNQTGQVADGIYFGGGASTTDISLGRDAAGILAQRDNINPQAFRLYNTFTDTVSAFERLNIKWDTNVLKLGTEKGSTGGLGRAMELQTDGTTRMTITSAGDIGIGTATPQNKLDVNGDTRVGGWLHVDRTGGSLSSYLAFKVRGAAEVGNFGNPAGNGQAEIIFANVSGLVIGTNATSPIIFATQNLERLRILGNNGNVGIGTTTPTEKLDVVGNAKVSGHFSAATKSFLIDHPTKAGKKLQYGVVESDQHSVLVRGKTSESIIELPEEWVGLVHEDSVTVQLTPIGSYQPLFVVSQDNQRVVVGGSSGQYNYTIYGERKDVDKLITEI